MSEDTTSVEDQGDNDQDAAEDSVEAVPEPERRHGVLVTDSLGDTILHPTIDQYLEAASALRDEGFDQLIDLTAVDYLTYAGSRSLPAGIDAERFEVVVSLLAHSSRDRVRIRVQVSAHEPVVPSLFDLWPGSEALEREVYDMFGVEFAEHPDLSRILMPEDWIGHPLRKDYAIGAIPVQFKAASNVR